MKTNPSNISVVILVVGAFAIRIGYCAATGTLGHTPQKGYREYVMAGERLLASGTLVSPLILDDAKAGRSSLLPPGYVALVAASYGLFGVESWAATVMLQIANGAATTIAAGVMWLIAGSVGGRRAAWGAGVISAVNPTLIGFTSYIWETSLFSVGVAVSVWLSLRLARTPARARSYFVYGLWLGALALLNPALTIAYPLLVLFPLWRTCGANGKRLSIGVMAAVLGWAIAITPWTIRNYSQLGELTYVRSGFMLELWLGVCPEADANGAAVYDKQFPLNNAEVQRKVAEIGEGAFIKECGRKAKEAIARDPMRFAKLVLMRVVDYWTGAALTHAEPGGGVLPRSRGRLFVMVFFSMEVLVLIVVLFYPVNSPGITRWLIGIIVLFSIVYCITHVQIRFRTPTEPLTAALIGMLVFGRANQTGIPDRRGS